MTLPYQDPQLAVDQRVDDLLDRMTLEDKAGMLFHSVYAPGTGVYLEQFSCKLAGSGFDDVASTKETLGAAAT